MGLLAHCFLLLNLSAGFHGQVSNQTIYFTIIVFLTLLELLGHGFTLSHLPFDDISQLLLLFLPGLCTLDYFIHKCRDIVPQSCCNLLYDFHSFFFLFIYFCSHYFQSFLYGVDQCVFFLFAECYFAFDFCMQYLLQIL